MIKKLLITAFITMGLNQAIAADAGTVTINGDVRDSTCTVSTSDLNQKIALGTFSVTQAIAVAGWALIDDAKQVDIHVTGCPASVTSADAQLTYTTDRTTYYVKNTGTAKGILLQPLKGPLAKNATPPSSLSLPTGDETAAASVANGSATVSFWMGVQRDKSNTPTAGTINGSVSVAMDYN